MALIEYPVLRNADLELKAILDTEVSRIDTDNQRVYRLASFKLIKHVSTEWVVRLRQDRDERNVVDSGLLELGEHFITGDLDTTRFFDGSFTCATSRKARQALLARSVSVGSNDHSEGFESVTTTATTGTITPSGSLFVVSAGQGADDFAEFDISDSFADTITWTKIGEPFGNDTKAHLWVGTGWSSGTGTVTLTVNNGGTALRLNVSFDTFTGHDASTPNSESNTGTGTASTLSISLVGVAADARSFGVVADKQNDSGITPGTSFTELVDHNSAGAGGNRSRQQTQYATSAGGATPVDWSALNTDGHSGIALEIAAAAAVDEGIRHWQHQKSYPRGVMSGVLRGAIR